MTAPAECVRGFCGWNDNRKGVADAAVPVVTARGGFMSRVLFTRRIVSLLGATLLCLWAIPTVVPAGEPPAIDPEAARVLKGSTDFLAGLQRFGVTTRSTIEAVLASGQKIQFDHRARLLVQRPDRLRAERLGDLVDQLFFYDGQSLTLYNPDDKYYATLPAPGSIGEMLDFARDTLDIVAPAADLIYPDAYDLLMEGVESGFVVGDSVVDGVRCTHLAFRAPQVDWQIWIQQQGDPLPRKLVITTRDVVNAPQFAVFMPEWDLSPGFDDGDFVFTPPSDALGIDFLARDGSVVTLDRAGGNAR